MTEQKLAAARAMLEALELTVARDPSLKNNAMVMDAIAAARAAGISTDA